MLPLAKRFCYAFVIVSLSQTLLSCPQAAKKKPISAQKPNQTIPVQSAQIEDTRAYQHGIDLLPLPDGNYFLVWASSGNPPTGALANGNWPHDIYYSKINTKQPSITPIKLISKPEAQEPASAALSADGHIMVTMEDGWNTPNDVAQRYGVYDSQFNPILPYPHMAFDGGHSGHVAAVGNHFVIFYGDDWVDGGGVDNLGSGNDVKALIYSSAGKLQNEIDIAVNDSSRDWWPLVAGSPTKAALVWQRFVDGQTYSQLMVSILDVERKRLLVNAVKLEDAVKYYTYSVAYLPNISRFLILGAYQQGGGFAYLLDEEGKVTASNKSLPPIVRESQSVVLSQSGSAKVAQPIAPTGLMVLSITPSEISLKTTQADNYLWQYSGTDGLFVNPNTVYMVSTSPAGLVEKTFHLPAGN